MWNMPEAEYYYKKALEKNPNSVKSRSGYSIFLNCVERHGESIREARTAAELDPMSMYYSSMIANSYNFAGRYDEAICHYTEYMNQFPDHFFFHYFHGFAFHGKGL